MYPYQLMPPGVRHLGAILPLRWYQIASRRIIERAADHGIPQEDVIIDPIAMTVAADPTCGVITLETMRLIRDQLGNNMTCGASNTSFGLPGRETLGAGDMDGFCGVAESLAADFDVPLTYEDFAAFWPSQKDNPFTEVLDNTQKYVASTTLKEPLPWGNSTLLNGDARQAVADGGGSERR